MTNTAPYKNITFIETNSVMDTPTIVFIPGNQRPYHYRFVKSQDIYNIARMTQVAGRSIRLQFALRFCFDYQRIPGVDISTPNPILDVAATIRNFKVYKNIVPGQQFPSGLFSTISVNQTISRTYNGTVNGQMGTRTFLGLFDCYITTALDDNDAIYTVSADMDWEATLRYNGGGFDIQPSQFDVKFQWNYTQDSQFFENLAMQEAVVPQTHSIESYTWNLPSDPPLRYKQ